MRVFERAAAWRGEALLSVLWLIRALFRPLGLINSYHALVIRQVRRTGLFDRAYYLETNGDVALAGTRPLRHYVTSGDRDGRSPMAFFDPVFYRAHARGRTKQVNALLHYSLVGRYRRTSPSPWFDVAYYLSINKDVARAGLDPLLHYLRFGGLEGRSPCPQFDGSYYLRANPDVLDGRMNPLLHYLHTGRLEGRSTRPEQQGTDTPEPEQGAIPQPSLPGDEAWSALKPRAGGDQAAVAVVVPVYKGRVETLRCLYSVLIAASQTPFELVVINDASPDLELTEDLRRLAGQRLFTLHVNPKNRGFIHTVNRGMALHSGLDVVLLNADTEVYDGWLDRLRAAAQRAALTGTVTPLSNNAQICGYPYFPHDNPFPLELGYAELDALTARVNAGVEVEAPTGVGFCMYIKRSCLNAVGAFDEKAFGKGYGEENDFCQRALRKGWRNVIAADVFVRHWGCTSFQGERSKRVRAALEVIDARYPRYQQDVDDFIRANPLAEARRRLDWARMGRMRRDKNVLIVSHTRGGGTERHILEDIERLTGEGYGVFRMRPAVRKPSHAVLCHPALKSTPNLPRYALAEVDVLAKALSELGITEVHCHGMVDYAPDAPERVVALARALGARYEVNLHDYKFICPRINLADENGRYCGEPGATECNNRCLPQRGSEFGVSDIRDWIAMHRRVLLAVDKVLVPDQDMADRLSRYFPDMSFEVSPHEDLDPLVKPLTLPRVKPGERLRVVVVGAIGKLKGFNVLRACALDARQRGLPLEFIVMGYSMNDRLMEEAGVRVTGKYQDYEALDTLNALQPHLVWLPSLWPETYSYTLSLALRSGLPVMAFDLGAIATRLRKLNREEFLMPLSLADRPGEVNSVFLNMREASLNGGAPRLYEKKAFSPSNLAPGKGASLIRIALINLFFWRLKP